MTLKYSNNKILISPRETETASDTNNCINPTNKLIKIKTDCLF